MTNKEAIERLVEMLPIDLVVSRNVNIHRDGKEVEALRTAITALRAQAEKEH